MSLECTPVEEIGPVVQNLRKYFNTGKTKTAEWRKKQLNLLIKLLQENKKDIIEALKKDLMMDAFICDVEVSGGILECEDALDSLEQWMTPDAKSIPASLQPGSGKIYKDPLGVVALISPWNYPCSLLVRPLIGAIAAGNCVLIKPSEVSEHTSGLMGKLVTSYLDTSAIAVVQGGVLETTEVLKCKYDKIMYTGNGFVGRIVMRAAAEYLTPCILELGGKSPLIIDEHVDMSVAIPRICWGKFLNCGQTCIAPDYALVHESRYEEFVDKLSTQIETFYGKDPSKSGDYGKIINSRHAKRISDLIQSSGKVVCGGVIDVDKAYVSPTLVVDATLDSKIMTEEIFGPVLPILKIKDINEAITFVNDRAKPLALYIFSKNGGVVEHVLTQTSSGGGCVNDVVLHNICKEMPFGGVGESGMGAYNGKISFDAFTHHKTMLCKPQTKDVALRFPPFTDSKVQWLGRIEYIARIGEKHYRKGLVVFILVLAYFLLF